MNFIIRIIKALYYNTGPNAPIVQRELPVEAQKAEQVKIDLPEVKIVQEVKVQPEMPNVATFREDQKLSEHFTLYELTATSNEKLQSENRTLTPEQIVKLKALAEFLEIVRDILGCPVQVNSGYRCLTVNGSTLGSSSTSQHPRCEASDILPKGCPLDDAFEKLRCAAKAGKLKFGQLILEQAQRSYGTMRWIHVSVVGTLDKHKVGQVMTMTAGVNGIPTYTLLETLI